MYGVLLDQTGTWEDCYIAAVSKQDHKVGDFCLAVTREETFFVAAGNSLWKHQIKSGLIR
jgi:hypothetical protein